MRGTPMQMVFRHFDKALIYELINISSLEVSPKINTCFLIPATWTFFFFFNTTLILGRLEIRLKNNTCSTSKWNSEDTVKFIYLETNIQSAFIIN